MKEVIESIADVTPERMTRILRSAAGRDDVSVTDVRIVRKKRLPYSTVARLELTYGTNKTGFPGHLFLKLVDHRSLEGVYAKPGAEADFYQRLAPEMSSPPLVRCYSAAISDDRSHILLADLTATHSQPRQNRSPSKLESIRGVEALAKCHARWWSDSRLGREIGAVFSAADVERFVADLETNVARFLEAAGDHVTSDQRSAYELMLSNAPTIWGRLMNRKGLTVTHGDCHWWNFLFPRDRACNAAVYIFDWHLWHLDLGARDLAFLIALGGFAEPRPEIEAELLDRYHETLIANGVANYTRDDLLTDYRISSVRNLNMPVIFWAQGKHPETWQSTLRRAFDSFTRLDCGELLSA